MSETTRKGTNGPRLGDGRGGANDDELRAAKRQLNQVRLSVHQARVFIKDAFAEHVVSHGPDCYCVLERLDCLLAPLEAEAT